MAFAGSPSQSKRIYLTPTKKLSNDQIPVFTDDLDFENMVLALDRQINRFKQIALNDDIVLGGETYKTSHLLKSLIRFKGLVENYLGCSLKKQKVICWQELNHEIRNQFHILSPQLKGGDKGFGEEDFAHFTSYYTPQLKVTRVPTKTHSNAIYNRPRKNEPLARSTRHEIDFQGALKNKGLALFYAQDLFDLYLLHVEGGGKAVLPNGESHYLSFNGTNRKAWRFISLYMREKGMIDNLSIAAQRDYLSQNPHHQEEVYSYCPSYVYFKITDHPPEGSDLVPLTDNRSIATDNDHYGFKGLISFVKTKRLKSELKEGEFNPYDPEEESYRDFSRFMLDQDTGGAIVGKARVDLYFGEDEYAGRAAQYVNHKGQLYFLILKKLP